MPFELTRDDICITCPHGMCVQYIREQSKKMKDRDTLYRIGQASGLACAFDHWIPGFSKLAPSDLKIIDFSEQVIRNAKTAGAVLEAQEPNRFGEVEAPFIVTAGQSGKVRGDTFEMLCRAIFWNCAALSSRQSQEPTSSSFSIPTSFHTKARQDDIAILTLGDNYDLKKLLTEESSRMLSAFEANLDRASTSIQYSTPDVVCINISKQGPDVKTFFGHLIENLDRSNQERLSTARSHLEGKVRPQDIRFAAGIKTSIRSDRMYQFLYEANSWKFIWREAFKTTPSPYYVLTSQTFGADPKKLTSVDFSSAGKGMGNAQRAIDGTFTVQTPQDLIDWLATVIGN